MVDDVAGAWACRLLGGWARLLPLECCSGGSATLYAPVGVALDDCGADGTGAGWTTVQADSSAKTRMSGSLRRRGGIR